MTYSGLSEQLNDLDFADDLALLSHNQQQMQKKISTVAENSKTIGLNIHRGKSKVLKASTTPLSLKGRRLKRWRVSPILAA
jgi:hypothetical protein